MQSDVDFLGVFLADQKFSILGKGKSWFLIGKSLPAARDLENVHE